MVCIVCPRGCVLDVKERNGEISVSGNYCKRGEEYGISETRDPKRVLTCLIRPEGRTRPVSVKSDKMIPKDMLLKCAIEVYRHHPVCPIHPGDVLIENILGTGCNIVAAAGTDE